MTDVEALTEENAKLRRGECPGDKPCGVVDDGLVSFCSAGCFWRERDRRDQERIAALEKRLAELARDQVLVESFDARSRDAARADRDRWRARAESAEAERDKLRADLDEMTRQRADLDASLTAELMGDDL